MKTGASCGVFQRFPGASFPGEHQPPFSSPTSAGVWGRALHIAHLLRVAAKTRARAGGKENLLWGLLPTPLLDQRDCTAGLRGFH